MCLCIFKDRAGSGEVEYRGRKERKDEMDDEDSINATDKDSVFVACNVSLGPAGRKSILFVS